MDIYSILASKPHNPHYLNRYVTFIKKCQQKNIKYEGYTEEHHICPKADDMFPEYTCFKTNPWNCAVLTARQHYIAHIILWKTFYDVRSCAESLWFMSNGKWKDCSNSSRFYESVKLDLRKVWKENGKILGKTSLNTVPVYNPLLQKVIKISKEHPEYISGELKHHSTGHKVGRNSAGEIIYASIGDYRFASGEYRSLNEKMVPVRDLHGKFFQVSKDDVRYVSGELKHNSKDTIWINNGTIEKTVSKDCVIPDEWVFGRITNNAKGTVWVKHIYTGERKRINPRDIEEYQSRGFMRGR